MHLVPFRYLTFIATAAIFVLSLFYYDHYWLPCSGALTLLGISDMLQTKRPAPQLSHPCPLPLREHPPRNPPVFPGKRHGSDAQYQRAKEQTDKRPFGTQLDVAGYEWINHSP
jgi:hypothetical protein